MRFLFHACRWKVRILLQRPWNPSTTSRYWCIIIAAFFPLLFSKTQKLTVFSCSGFPSVRCRKPQWRLIRHSVGAWSGRISPTVRGLQKETFISSYDILQADCHACHQQRCLPVGSCHHWGSNAVDARPRREVWHAEPSQADHSNRRGILQQKHPQVNRPDLRLPCLHSPETW